LKFLKKAPYMKLIDWGVTYPGSTRGIINPALVAAAAGINIYFINIL
jgi:hypothetical protein